MNHYLNQFANLAWYFYSRGVVVAFTALWIAIIVIGGDVHVNIHWDNLKLVPLDKVVLAVLAVCLFIVVFRKAYKAYTIYQKKRTMLKNIAKLLKQEQELKKALSEAKTPEELDRLLGRIATLKVISDRISSKLPSNH